MRRSVVVRIFFYIHVVVVLVDIVVVDADIFLLFYCFTLYLGMFSCSEKSNVESI